MDRTLEPRDQILIDPLSATQQQRVCLLFALYKLQLELDLKVAKAANKFAQEAHVTVSISWLEFMAKQPISQHCSDWTNSNATTKQ